MCIGSSFSSVHARIFGGDFYGLVSSVLWNTDVYSYLILITSDIWGLEPVNNMDLVLGCGVIFNAAAAILSFSQCAHVGGQLSFAKDLYERAITIISNTKETELTLASVAMAPEEVHIGALAGLGQLASHLGYASLLFHNVLMRQPWQHQRVF